MRHLVFSKARIKSAAWPQETFNDPSGFSFSFGGEEFPRL
jgi:hypothetical protein